jgi:dephospho-CoA kinase
MIVIGITGTLGAGKGTIVKYMQEKEGFEHFSVRDFIAGEIQKRGLDLNRDTLTMTANDLRAKNSPSYIIDQLFIEARKTGKNSIIESIRTPGEILSLREKGRFFLFAVDADEKIRFSRIKSRGSETDHIDFETFIANERREMNTDDPNKQNLKKCIEMADYKFTNDGTVEGLEAQVAKIVAKIKLDEETRIISKRFCPRV